VLVFSYFKREGNLSLLVFREKSCNFFHLVKVLYSCPVVFSPYLLRGFHVKFVCSVPLFSSLILAVL